MTKSESILKLEELGLNILPYFFSRDKQEILHYLAKHANDIVSMRTERGEEFQCPYYYSLKGEDLVQKAIHHLADGYTIILYPSLDSRGCKMFGTVALTCDSMNIMEFVIGPGKIRDLYTHPEKKTVFIPRISMNAVKQSEFGDNAEILNSVFVEVKEKCIEETPCVVEWSYYNSFVGIKSQHVIYWELRRYA